AVAAALAALPERCPARTPSGAHALTGLPPRAVLPGSGPLDLEVGIS
ncbi:hypothetical protein GTW63_12385, partial [Streptomyces sp. SID6137]|nr:hypothetical protein [Streptomyces sp. SID6137]